MGELLDGRRRPPIEMELSSKQGTLTLSFQFAHAPTVHHDGRYQRADADDTLVIRPSAAARAIDVDAVREGSQSFAVPQPQLNSSVYHVFDLRGVVEFADAFSIPSVADSNESIVAAATGRASTRSFLRYALDTFEVRAGSSVRAAMARTNRATDSHSERWRSVRLRAVATFVKSSPSAASAEDQDAATTSAFWVWRWRIEYEISVAADLDPPRPE